MFNSAFTATKLSVMLIEMFCRCSSNKQGMRGNNTGDMCSRVLISSNIGKIFNCQQYQARPLLQILMTCVAKKKKKITGKSWYCRAKKYRNKDIGQVGRERHPCIKFCLAIIFIMTAKDSVVRMLFYQPDLSLFLYILTVWQNW